MSRPIGDFRPTGRNVSSINPAMNRVGPTGSDNLGGGRPSAWQIGATISLRVWKWPSETLYTFPAALGCCTASKAALAESKEARKSGIEGVVLLHDLDSYAMRHALCAMLFCK